jgi:outer membrane immunogenic protein
MGIWAILGAATLAMTAANGAMAADIAPVTQYDWGGFYVGAHAGYGMGSAYFYDENVASGLVDWENTYNVNGLLFGLQAGWNKQSGNFVWGLEGDAEYNGLYGLDPVHAFAAYSESRVNFSSSIRGRAGLANDKALLYVTAGPELSNIQKDRYGGGFATHDSLVGLALGFTAGAGVEYAIDPKWSVGLEGRYTDYGYTKLQSVNTDTGWYKADSFKDVSVRLSANMHF